MRLYKQIATAGVAITVIGAVAGCATGNETTPSANTTVTNSTISNNTVPTATTTTTNNTVSNNTVTTTNSTTGTNPSSSFPSLIQHAMHEISAKTSIVLYAPTTYPGAVHTPLPVTVQTSVSNSPVPNYSVLFNRNDSNIGSFTIYNWNSNGEAVQHLLPGNKSLYAEPSLATVSDISLGTGISAKVERLPIKGKDISALVWTEGRWTMEVLYGTSLQGDAVHIGKQIVQYCHFNYLPAPDTKGYVLSSLASGNVNTYVSWNKGEYVFNTIGGGAWNSSLSGGYLSALEMAVQMKAYQ